MRLPERCKKITLSRPALVLCVVLLLAPLGFPPPAGQDTEPDPSGRVEQIGPFRIRQLVPGTVYEEPLTPDVIHVFAADVRRGEAYRFDLRENGADALLKVYEETGLYREVNFGEGFGREAVTYLPERDTPVFVVVRFGQRTRIDGTGSFRLTAHYGNKASEKDRQRAAAEQLLDEGTGYFPNEKERLTAAARLERALGLWERLGDGYWYAYTANSLGLAHWKLSRHQQAFYYYDLAAAKFDELGDKWAMGILLNNFSQVMVELGDLPGALEALQIAIMIFDELDDPRREMLVLHNIGRVFLSGRAYEEGIPVLKEALRLAEVLGVDDVRIGGGIGLGGCYVGLERYAEARKVLHGVLDEAIEAGFRFEAGIAAHNLAEAYEAEGDTGRAAVYYRRALLYETESGNRWSEANTFTEMMRNSAERPRLAAFYGKLAVNLYQDLRAANRELDIATQKQFLRMIFEAYGRLSERLIADGRLDELQQVLNLFKDQQHYDFDRPADGATALLAMTPRESVLAGQLELARRRVIDVDERLASLTRELGQKQKSEEISRIFSENMGGGEPEPAVSDEDAADRRRLDTLEKELRQAEENYLALFERFAGEFARKADDDDRIGRVIDLVRMQGALRDISAATGQTTVAVYQLAGGERFHSLIVSADRVEAVSAPSGYAEMDALALDLWALLRSPGHDPRPVGGELYERVFAPLAGRLPKDTKVILWSLDRSLRYVPMAALWDGERYLAERYRNVVFTRADTERMLKEVSPEWTGTGFGGSRPAVVELSGEKEKISFAALPGVTEELGAIFRTGDDREGVIGGEVLHDADFTKEAFYDLLGRGRPVVHIASHFSFRPGDDTRSFLLLGDGRTLTLNEMKQKRDLFAGVELLTLSACDTAAAREDASGREIDGFAELAQRLGAGSVMATLWPVSDSSTPRLMRDFYRIRQSRRGMTKAEALQRAQLGLLRGETKVAPRPDAELRTGGGSRVRIEIVPDGRVDRRRGGDERGAETFYIEKSRAPVYVRDPERPFAHPYYWAPFVIYGNWR